MLESDLNSVIELLIGLWPNAELTDAELGIFRSRIRGFDAGTVRTAMEEHRLESKFNRPTFSAILDRFRTASRRQIAPPIQMKIVQWIRRESKASYFDPGDTDHDVIAAHFGACWNDVRKHDAPQNALQCVRGRLIGDCFTALREIGWDADDAIILARQTMGLADGERLVIPPVLREVKSPQLKLAYTALQSLAAHELAKRAGITQPFTAQSA